MVARIGGYTGPPFKGYRGVTHVSPMYPMLFNLVVDATIHHWVTVEAETESFKERLGLSMQYLAAYFYANDGLIASTQPERMQWLFNFLK